MMLPHQKRPLCAQHSGRRALALIELLVVLLITLLLIALSLPVLSSSRSTAKAVSCLVQQKQQHTVITIYGQTHRDMFPYGIGVSGQHPYASEHTVDFAGPYEVNGYVALSAQPWNALGAALGAQARRSLVCPQDIYTTAGRSLIRPDLRFAEREISSYSVSAALYMAPDTLVPERPIWSRDGLVPQRWSNVVYPASKALLFDSAAFHDSRFAIEYPVVNPPWTTAVTACDGSGSIRNTADCMPGVVFPPFHGTALHEGTARIFVFQLTPHGVRGHDW